MYVNLIAIILPHRLGNFVTLMTFVIACYWKISHMLDLEGLFVMVDLHVMVILLGGYSSLISVTDIIQQSLNCDVSSI